jgi:Fe-Mn family superoxide dismutase
MVFQLPPLPYATNALEPHMSARTLEVHHDKHHRAYVTALNALIDQTPLANLSLEAIIRATAKDPSKAAIFHNAAQAWSHTFFWHSMKPAGGGSVPDGLARLIDQSFGSRDKFDEKFRAAAMALFGSGWMWLILDHGKLAIVKMPNANNPIVQGHTALLVCDLWEHAYYLDYQNRRADFVKTFLDHLVDWEFAAQNLTKSAERSAA